MKNPCSFYGNRIITFSESLDKPAVEIFSWYNALILSYWHPSKPKRQNELHDATMGSDECRKIWNMQLCGTRPKTIIFHSSWIFYIPGRWKPCSVWLSHPDVAFSLCICVLYPHKRKWEGTKHCVCIMLEMERLNYFMFHALCAFLLSWLCFLETKERGRHWCLDCT